ncbi:hypothetical protein FRB99_006908 [Tulasnella sp. 403]|nr:hypothetical protein FRB99_006908 [Tulasnella sp. 403]
MTGVAAATVSNVTIEDTEARQAEPATTVAVMAISPATVYGSKSAITAIKKDTSPRTAQNLNSRAPVVATAAAGRRHVTNAVKKACHISRDCPNPAAA